MDVTVLGAGPSGLSAAYYVGHRDGTVRIVESLEQIGGQVAATYPEKHVYDVAGFPKILGQKLVDMCAEQGLQYGADVRLGEEAKTLERVSRDGEEVLALTTDKGNTYLSRAMIITAGHGAFEPRRLGVEDIDQWLGRGLHYVVREKAQFAGKRCVIVGGGDSALDWTLGLQDTAGLPITLVHRRDRFRALESSMNEARRLEAEGAVRILTPHEVREVHGDGSIEAVTIENTGTGEARAVRLRGSDHAARLRLPSGRDRRVGARARGQAPDPDRPDDLRDLDARRLRRGRRRRLPREDHADHRRHGRGGDRGEQRDRRRSGARRCSPSTPPISPARAIKFHPRQASLV